MEFSYGAVAATPPATSRGTRPKVAADTTLNIPCVAYGDKGIIIDAEDPQYYIVEFERGTTESVPKHKVTVGDPF